MRRARTAGLLVLLVVLAAPALVLTTVRVLDPDAAVWQRAISFTPLATVPYAVLLALLVLLAVFGRGSRRRWLAAAAAVLVPLALHAWWFAPQWWGTEPDPAADASTLTVVTANLLAGAGDGREVLARAVEHDADVLVLQEITPGGLAAMESAGLDLAFPHRVGEVGDSTEGTMLLARLPLTDETRIQTDFGSWAATLDLDGTAVRVLGIHTRPPLGDAAQWWTDHQLLLDAATEAQQSEVPTLVAGDFNATPDHRPMREMAELGLRGVTERAHAGWQPTWPAERIPGMAWSVLGPLVQIDHVLADRHWLGVAVHTADIPGSDHRAVIATVALR